MQEYDEMYFKKRGIDTFNPRFKKFYKKLIEKIVIEFLKDSKFILDAGCGSGNQMSILKEYNKRVIGIDSAKISVRLCLNKELNVCIADVRNLPFRNRFDGLISWCVLEHLKNPRVVIKEFNRVLKNKGRLLIAVEKPSKEFKLKDKTHVKPFTKEEITHLLSEYGFKVVKIRSDLYYKGMSRLPFKIAYPIGSFLGKFTSSIIVVYAVKV